MKLQIPTRGIRTLLLTVLGVAMYQAELRAEQDVDGVLRPGPVTGSGCIAIEVNLPEGKALAGVRWFNNDQNVVFPRVLAMAGEAGGPPAIDAGGYEAGAVSGSQGWSEMSLTPLASATGTLYLVFIFPAEQRTGEGADGGPGFGYRFGKEEFCVYLSRDGQQWLKMRSDIEMAVEPILGVPKAAPLVLSPEVQTPETLATEDTGTLRPHGTLHVYPNPFNPRTTIEFSLVTPGEAAISIYRANGRLVRMLFKGTLPSGSHAIQWEGDDHSGSAVASGVYYVQLQAGTAATTRAVTLVR